MRTADIDILIVPGEAGDAPDLWLRRWEGRLPTARRVAPAEPARLAAWTEAIAAAVAGAARPVVLVAHDLGVLAVAHAGPELAAPHGSAGRVAGAFLVAPPSAAALADRADFAAPVPGPLPFPALFIASRDDPRAGWAESEALAARLGATLVDGGASGHFDAASGHGPWPEGLMRFAGFLKGLG